MDSIWNNESLLLFIIFFIPGFIAQKVYGLIIADETRDNATVITSAVAYSCLNYALAAPLIWWVGLNWAHLAAGWLIAATSMVVLILPIFLPLLWVWVRGWAFIKNRTLSPIKRPWDTVFNRRNEYWVIVTFKNGTKMAGTYRKNSSASTYPIKEQIYLEQVWVLAPDGTFDHQVENTRGAIILGDEIMTVELFRP